PVGLLVFHRADHPEGVVFIKYGEAFQVALKEQDVADPEGDLAYFFEDGLSPPVDAQHLRAIAVPEVDLLQVCPSRGLYIHPDFHGSASIKNVLPVLAPEFDQNYTEPHIYGGDEAMLAWADVVLGHIPEEKVKHLRQDLLAYCELDTLTMFKIWEELKKEVS
ncbi:MAG: hypothetical protein R6U57_09490, partial [Anaerolineales bacterium]